MLYPMVLAVEIAKAARIFKKPGGVHGGCIKFKDLFIRDRLSVNIAVINQV
jgi:hypothetical protein